MKRIPPEPLIQARHSLQGSSRCAIQRSCHAELFHWKTPTLLHCQHFSHAWESWRGLNCWESEIWWGDQSTGKWSSRCNSRPKWWWWCARAQSREYADGGDSPRDPFEEGLKPSPEPSPCSSPANRPSPAELLGSSSKPQHSSALARSLPPGISDPELRSQPTLISSPISTGTIFAHTVFQTKQQDTGKIRICLASDIRAPHSDIITLNPSQVDVESYCGLLKSECILDQEEGRIWFFIPLVVSRFLFSIGWCSMPLWRIKWIGRLIWSLSVRMFDEMGGFDFGELVGMHSFM